jgi:1-acyl-sn-glycerol-3-phosphate acyltransferase
MALGLLYWGIAGLIITLLGIILYAVLPKKYARSCGRFLLQKAFLIFINYLKLTGLIILDDSALDSLNTYKMGMIIAPNHIALWDAVFIIAKIPQTICIMKGSILRNPFLGGGARLAGYIANDSALQMLRDGSKQLLAGEMLLVFPEGTRTKKQDQWVNSFQGATALMAKRSQVPIVPIYIRSDNRFFEKGSSLFKKPKFPLRLSFEVGEAVYFSGDESVQAFTQKLRQDYIKVLSKPHPLRRKKSTGL